MGTNVKALVVDDSAAARYMIGRIVKEIGYTVIEAANGREAIEMLTGSPDVVLALVDWNMPIMNGLELVSEIRKNQQLNGMKIMMVTTETEMMQVVRAIEAGANEYVMKPFTRDVVLDKMRIMGIEVP